MHLMRCETQTFNLATVLYMWLGWSIFNWSNLSLAIFMLPRTYFSLPPLVASSIGSRYRSIFNSYGSLILLVFR